TTIITIILISLSGRWSVEDAQRVLPVDDSQGTQSSPRKITFPGAFYCIRRCKLATGKTSTDDVTI
ncbi:MAG: hypothetical protein ACRCYI_10095, partial [Plesiomonas shigelloides]